MTGFTRKEHVVRAAQEAIAYQIRDVLDMMRADSKIKLHVFGNRQRVTHQLKRLVIERLSHKRAIANEKQMSGFIDRAGIGPHD